MSGFVLVGLCFGAIIGLLHAAHVVATQASGPAGRAKTLWRAVWILLLWTIFGIYVLAFWFAGAVLLGLSRGISALRTPRATVSEIRS